MRNASLLEEGGSAGELLTRRELAKLCKVSTRTVDNWVSSGKLPLIRLSRRCVRFSLPEVIKTLKAEQEGAAG